MAVSNPRTITDLYGEEYTFYTEGTDVKFVTDRRTTPITAFAQEVSDGPIDVDQDAAGGLTVAYVSAGNLRLSKSSQRDGDLGTWA